MEDPFLQVVDPAFVEARRDKTLCRFQETVEVTDRFSFFGGKNLELEDTALFFHLEKSFDKGPQLVSCIEFALHDLPEDDVLLVTGHVGHLESLQTSQFAIDQHFPIERVQVEQADTLVDAPGLFEAQFLSQLFLFSSAIQ